jgi:hypothetical protein
MVRFVLRVFIVCILVAGSGVACNRRPVQGSGPIFVQLQLRVTNNLRESLDLSVSGSSGVLWSGSVLANDSLHTPLGALPYDATVTLRATNVRGAVVSARNNVQVRSGTLIWIIP